MKRIDITKTIAEIIVAAIFAGIIFLAATSPRNFNDSSLIISSIYSIDDTTIA